MDWRAWCALVMGVWVELPRSVVERARREAERLGVTLGEYIADRLLADADPPVRAEGYALAASELLGQARRALSNGDLRASAGAAWGAAALALRAHAASRGQSLDSDGLWRYTRRLSAELGEWVCDAWAHAVAMRHCFLEGGCTHWHVERALGYIERLVSHAAPTGGEGA